MTLAFMITVFSCKPKTVGSSGSEININTTPVDKIARSKSKTSEAARKSVPEGNISEQKNIVSRDAHSFKEIDQQLKELLVLIPPPKNGEEDEAINALCRKMLELKKDLLLSIPTTPQAKRDCEEAWDTLENPSFFNTVQDRYVRELFSKYSDSSQLEKLVIWRLTTLRMDSGLKRGSGALEEVLKIEITKFLLSALGIDKHELFEAMHLKTRSLSEEAGRKGNQAEEEVFKIYSEQSERAETILENHFKRSP